MTKASRFDRALKTGERVAILPKETTRCVRRGSFRFGFFIVWNTGAQKGVGRAAPDETSDSDDRPIVVDHAAREETTIFSDAVTVSPIWPIPQDSANLKAVVDRIPFSEVNRRPRPIYLQQTPVPKGRYRRSVPNVIYSAKGAFAGQKGHTNGCLTPRCRC